MPLDRPDLLHDGIERLLAANQRGWGAYFAVGLRRRGLSRYQRGGVADVVALPALFVDIDSPDADWTLADVPPPSCVVHSGGGFHLYWWLDSPSIDLARCGAILRGLARTLGGDHLSVAQSLRLPSSRNTKPHRHNALCEIVHLSEERCALDDFRLPPPTYTPKAFPRVSSDMLNPALVQVVSERLSRMGYRQRGDWLYGACLYPAHHRHDDAHPSFGFNTRTGYGNCFRCGSVLLKDICAEIGIHPADYGGLFVD